MTKIELICLLIEMFFSSIIAIVLFSDIVAERKIDYRRVKKVIAIVLIIFSSFGSAVLMEYYYSLEFEILNVLVYGFSIFVIQFGISIIIGKYKIKKDEKKAWKEKFKTDQDIEEYFTHMRNDDNFVEIRENHLEERENCYRVVNDCCKIVSFEDFKKHRKGRK